LPPEISICYVIIPYSYIILLLDKIINDNPGNLEHLTAIKTEILNATTAENLSMPDSQIQLILQDHIIPHHAVMT
jgi:hypothetical protein